MRFTLKRAAAVVTAFVLFWTGLAFASPRMTPNEASVYSSERASRLLSEIQDEAISLTQNAGQLEALARHPQYNWQSHAIYLDAVKGRINAVGDRTAELQRISANALPWQQQAIAQVTAQAAQVAASTEAAILYLNGNHGRLFVPEYKDHVATIADSSQSMKQTVDNFLDYERAQQKFQRLQTHLELAE
jgi:signal transduction histidine kinase